MEAGNWNTVALQNVIWYYVDCCHTRMALDMVLRRTVEMMRWFYSNELPTLNSLSRELEGMMKRYLGCE
jgi:hypothetical protein